MQILSSASFPFTHIREESCDTIYGHQHAYHSASVSYVRQRGMRNHQSANVSAASYAEIEETGEDGHAYGGGVLWRKPYCIVLESDVESRCHSAPNHTQKHGQPHVHGRCKKQKEA